MSTDSADHADSAERDTVGGASRETVALLGLGAMGSRVGARLLDAGHDLRVWNRTPGAVADLVARGAVASATPEEAARGATVVLVCVRDDAAALETWRAALPGLALGLTAGGARPVAVDLSTLSPAGTEAVAELLADADIDRLAAPMVGSRPQVEAGQLRLLVGGSPEVLARVEPVLAAIAGSAEQVHHVGAPAQAAAAKLVVNGMLVSQLATLGELVSFASAAGLEETALADLLEQLPVTSPAVARSLPRILARDATAMFPLDLVGKDVGYLTSPGQLEPNAEPVLHALAQAVALTAQERDAGFDVVSLAFPHVLGPDGSRPDPAALVTRLLDALGRGDRESVATLMTPDFVLVEPSSLPWGGEHHGPDGYLAVMGQIAERFELAFAVRRLAGLPDGTVVLLTDVTFRDRHDPGRSVTSSTTEWFEVRDGSLSRSEVHLADTAALLDLIDGKNR